MGYKDRGRGSGLKKKLNNQSASKKSLKRILNTGTELSAIPDIDPSKIQYSKIASIESIKGPMLAMRSIEPFDDKDWFFEIKWDGYRVMAEISGNIVKLYSRNRKILNDNFKPIVSSLERLPYNALLDGEIVVVDDLGRSDFSALRKYIKNRTGNIVYYVFDILFYKDHSLIDTPLFERKKLLENILPPLPYIKISGHIEKTGISFFEAAKKIDLEGIIAKKMSGKYQPLKRSPDWLKIKSKHTEEVVMGGFKKPGTKSKVPTSFAVGTYRDNKLIYTGNIGSGFKDDELQDLYKKLKEITISSSPFFNSEAVPPSTTWVRPELVAEIQYSQMTPDGMMRHPVFKHLREDKDPIEVLKKNTDAPNKDPDLNIPVKKYRGSLSNLNKIFWEDSNYTKGDLIDYYFQVSKFILPHLIGRPQSLHRYPDGIKGNSFFQKDVNFKTPYWINTMTIKNRVDKKDIHYLVCKDLDSLIYMVNLGCIEINPWLSRVDGIDYPDFIIIDLDPFEIDFKSVIKVALKVKEVLDILGIKGFIKTSGATGIHIYIPLGANYNYGQVLKFAKILAILIHRKISDLTSIERSPEKRHNRVYIDFLQNRKGQTVASVYSVRPRPGAPVSAPLHWDEVLAGLDPSGFNIKSMIKRLAEYGDIWKDLFLYPIDIEDILPRIEEFYKDDIK